MKKMLIAILLLSCLCAACTQEQVENPMDSATEAVATSEEISPKRIVPLPCTVDVNQLRDGTLAVSLKEDALRRDESGTLKMHLTVHTYDLYDMVDISRIKVGYDLYKPSGSADYILGRNAIWFCSYQRRSGKRWA